MGIDELRTAWRQRRGQEPPAALSKDLIVRALAHWLQEERLGGLNPHLRKLLSSSSKMAGAPARHVKIGYHVALRADLIALCDDHCDEPFESFRGQVDAIGIERANLSMLAFG